MGVLPRHMWHTQKKQYLGPTNADRFRQYSMYGHVKTLAEAELKGIKAAGGDADLFQ